MFKPIKTIFIILLSVSFLAACNNSGGPSGADGLSKKDVGTVTGAAIGGILGSNVGGGKGKTAATIVGALLGAYAGSSIGESLDAADRQYMAQTSTNALEYSRTGVTSTWKNPDSGNQGTFTPTRTYETSSQVCREYQQTITVGGQQEQAYGTACRQADGSWKIVNN